MGGNMNTSALLTPKSPYERGRKTAFSLTLFFGKTYDANEFPHICIGAQEVTLGNLRR
jgi:hypothetical protein